MSGARWVATLALTWFLGGSGATATAQLIHPNDVSRSGMQNPKFSPQGDYAEVVTVTPKWLVIQNKDGQQFPVAIDSIGSFVIRWPTTLEQVSPTALIETTGIDLNSLNISTDQIDVFEGSARGLVTPIFQQIIGYGRTPTMFDISNRNNYGVFVHLLPGEDQIPNRHHVVGTMIAAAPLRIAAPGNNAVTVLPSDNGVNISQITPGSASFLRAGDWVYIVPEEMTPKSLILSEMVGYKSMPLSQFVP